MPCCSALRRVDVWLEENNLLNELTEAPMSAMEGTLTEEQQEVREGSVDG